MARRQNRPLGRRIQQEGRPERIRLETAVKYGFRVVRWHLDEPEASAV